MPRLAPSLRRDVLRAALATPLLAATLAAASGAAGAPAAGVGAPAVPFVHDDYPKALAQAKAHNRPIFLEAWAPWCHSCRSMQAYVYTDAKLSPYADRFVWLAIDTEKASNAPTVAKFPVGAWPSMYVIDPKTEKVAFRWTGSATIEQLLKFLDEAGASVASNASASPAPAATSGGAQAALTRKLGEADRLYGAASWGAAATAYGELLVTAPAGWSSLPRAADAYLFSLQMADREADCARAAQELLPKVAGTASSATVAAVGLDCAVALPADAVGRAAAIEALEKGARAALADPRLAIAADDRSGLYISLIGARDDAQDEGGKKQLTGEWIALLESAATAAPTPQARAVFDSHRLSAYLEIGEPQRAIPMLEASQRDFPSDYNPPARLAVAYRALKEYPRALAASDRALTLAYGPRRLGILRTRAKIQAEGGDPVAAVATLESAVKEARALPAGQVSERTVQAIQTELDALARPASKS